MYLSFCYRYSINRILSVNCDRVSDNTLQQSIFTHCDRKVRNLYLKPPTTPFIVKSKLNVTHTRRFVKYHTRPTGTTKMPFQTFFNNSSLTLLNTTLPHTSTVSTTVAAYNYDENVSTTMKIFPSKSITISNVGSSKEINLSPRASHNILNNNTFRSRFRKYYQRPITIKMLSSHTSHSIVNPIIPSILAQATSRAPPVPTTKSYS